MGFVITGGDNAFGKDAWLCSRVQDKEGCGKEQDGGFLVHSPEGNKYSLTQRP